MTYLATPPAPIWHPIPGRPYEANLTTGEIRNAETGYVLTQTLHHCGSRCYMYCSIGEVHRRLMEAAIGRRLTRHEYVRHRDGVSINNTLSNLEIGSPQDNCRDKVRHNRNGRKLYNADIAEIRRLANTRPAKWIARKYGVTVRHIHAILAGTRWANLPC